MALEIEEQKLLELTEALEFLQLHSKVYIKIQGRKEIKCMQLPTKRGRSIGILICFVVLLGFCLFGFGFGLVSWVFFHLAWDLWFPVFYKEAERTCMTKDLMSYIRFCFAV